MYLFAMLVYKTSSVDSQRSGSPALSSDCAGRQMFHDIAICGGLCSRLAHGNGFDALVKAGDSFETVDGGESGFRQGDDLAVNDVVEIVGELHGREAPAGVVEFAVDRGRFDTDRVAAEAVMVAEAFLQGSVDKKPDAGARGKNIEALQKFLEE